MALSRPLEADTAETDVSGGDPAIEYLKSLAKKTLTDSLTLAESSVLAQNVPPVVPINNVPSDVESDAATSSDSSGPARIESTVEFLKTLSRDAERDASISTQSSDRAGKEPSEEIYEGLSSKADQKASSSTYASRTTKKESTGEYLEGLSRSILNVCLNLKDPNHPIIQKHQSPDFRNKHDALPKASNRDDHHENLHKHLAEQENFHVEIHNTSSEVDESRGRGTIYVWYEITGLAHGLEREAVAVLSWERKQGIWTLMKHVGMRGPAGFC